MIISPNDPDGMVQWAEECAAMGVKYIWDPGQQCARMEGSQLKSGVTGAFMVICNDYEFELIRQKTGMAEADILAHAPLLVVTKGEKGCTIHTKDGVEDVAAVPPDRIEDPTGVGDAFRGGFMKGLAMGAPYRRLRAARQRRRDLRARASRRHVARLHVGRVQAAATRSISARM